MILHPSRSHTALIVKSPSNNSLYDECLICFDKGTNFNPLIETQYYYKCGCKSTIHNECLKKWIQQENITSGTCPVCRTITENLSIDFLNT